MRVLRRAWNRLLASLTGKPRTSELAEELDFHIRQLADENIRRGVAPDEAYRRARLQFGSIDSTTESCRDESGFPFFDSIPRDLRYAMTGIRKNPGFSAVAILSLAIGIGANTAIFSLVHSVLLHPLAYKDPQRVYWVREMLTGGQAPVNPVHAREWAKECRSLEQVALMRGIRSDVASAASNQGEPISVVSADIPHNLFALLGVEPILGRTFLAEEEEKGHNREVLLLESLWRTRFHGDRSLVGKSILVDRQLYTVVGIIPDSFRLPFSRGGLKFELFRPLSFTPEELARTTGNYNYSAVVRVKPGVAPAQALADINVVQARFREPSGFSRNLTAVLVPVHEVITGQARAGLWMLAAAVGTVMLIVCINLANLLLARMASRTREAAIRTALGASRGRQFRMVLIETLLLAVGGGALGVLFAFVCVHLLVATTTLNIPRLNEVRVDSTVLAFACGLTLLTGVVFGALPAWRLTSGDPQNALRNGSPTVTEGRRGLRLRESLVGMEVALSAALLIVAGLLTVSLTQLLRVEKGFDAGHVLTVSVNLSGSAYEDDGNRQRFFDRLLPKVSAIPGVRTAGLTTFLPTLGNIWNDPIYLEGAPRDSRHPVDNRYASPGYFGAMDIPVLHGRAFDERDRGRGVAVLSEKAAQLLWPGHSNPVGQRFMGEDDKPKVLVGMVAEVRAALESKPPPMAYYPYWQRPPANVTLVVRTAGNPYSAAGALRAVLHGEDSQLPIQAIRTMDEVVDGSLAQRRFQLTLMGAFAASALLVASLGIYGIVSCTVTRRRSEIGIRMALGAQRQRLLSLVVRQGMIPVLIGLAAGVTAALFLGQAIRGLLFGVTPTNALTIVMVTALLLIVGVLACVVPARRAAGTDAIAALRFE